MTRVDTLALTQLGPRFRAFAKERGLVELATFGPAVPTELDVGALIALMRAYFDAYDFAGCAKTIDARGVHGDALLYQHGPRDGYANVTRQLYKGRRGIQLCVTLVFRPAPRDVATLWSYEPASLDAWAKRARAAAKAAGILDRPAQSIQARLDRF